MKCSLLNCVLFSMVHCNRLIEMSKKKLEISGEKLYKTKFRGQIYICPLCKSLVGAYNMSKQYQQIFMVLVAVREKEKPYCSHIKCTIVSYYQGKNFRLTELTQVTQSDSGVFQPCQLLDTQWHSAVATFCNTTLLILPLFQNKARVCT